MPGDYILERGGVVVLPAAHEVDVPAEEELTQRVLQVFFVRNVSVRTEECGEEGRVTEFSDHSGNL